MSDQGFDEGGTDLGNVSGFMAQSIRDGLSANEALREFREAGGAMRRDYWLQGYSEVRDVLSREDTAGALDPGALPDGTDYGEWAMGRGGQYATQVTVFLRDIETGTVTPQQYTYVTDDPHTPEEAELNAIEDFGDAEAVSDYGQAVQGAVTTAVFATVPWQAA